MTEPEDSPIDGLWAEYGQPFKEWDDLTLARWLAQTLGQLQGRSWRMSHPLMGACRLASQIAHERQVWLKRLVNLPNPYTEAPCCRAPFLPLITRDIVESGLVCQHCGQAALELTELPEALQTPAKEWANLYAPVHQVAHWDDRQRKSARNYDRLFEDAAGEAEDLLARLGKEIAPLFLDHYPSVIWEDQDECLEVRPEDIRLSK